MWHAVGKDRNPLRKQYLEAIVPPFVAILRRWRPLLAGIHELATADGLNPLVVDDRALAADALPIEVNGILAFFLPLLFFCCLVVVLLYRSMAAALLSVKVFHLFLKFLYICSQELC